MTSDETKEGGPWYPDWEHARPLRGIVLTMVAIIAWLVFILLYALFWSNGFTLFQNVVVTVVTLVITAMVIGLGWVVWGFRHVKQWKRPQ
ncbi:MAG TPA: hypothetical protein VEB87_04815 [Nitrososphaerales archaeon]|jgi:hypothetical protein|nr:hypothetical protein [Nitrososphaerales archaeon]